MNKKFKTLEKLAPIVLRYGLSIVILWFSLQQFLHTQSWTAYVPDSVVSMTGIGAVTLVYFNAIFELIFGVLLLFGFFTRISALLLGIHMLDIMWVVGYGEIGVRDFGLAIATLVVFMQGSDSLCMDYIEESINTINVSSASLLKPISPSTNPQAPKVIINS